MSSFRRYGGLNYSANNSITRSYISNSEQMNVNNYSGQKNSKETFASHVDMSGNSILHTGCIYFQDGSFMCTASNNGDQEYTQWMNGQYNSSIYYNFGNVGIGTTTPSSELEVNGNITTETITQTSDYRIKENIKP